MTPQIDHPQRPAQRCRRGIPEPAHEPGIFAPGTRGRDTAAGGCRQHAGQEQCGGQPGRRHGRRQGIASSWWMATCAAPSSMRFLGCPNQQGLSTWLQAGGDPPLQNTGVDGLQVLASGPVGGNPVALLSAKRLGERLAELRQRADYVLIDAPPLLAVTDAALWASQVDGVVLLVNAGATKRDAAQRAKTVLEGVQAKVLGAVLLNAEKGAGVSGYQK